VRLTLMKVIHGVSALAIALLLCSCSPANGLGEQAVEDPYALPGDCPDVGVTVIDYAASSGYPSTLAAIQSYLDTQVQSGHATPEQAQLLTRALTEAATNTKSGQMVDLITSQQMDYTVSTSIEKLPDGTSRVEQFSLECTGHMSGG
jgi:hypothetical protein